MAPVTEPAESQRDLGTRAKKLIKKLLWKLPASASEKRKRAAGVATETYFRKLNYSLGNEDTAMELAILPDGVGHVFTVAGSGSRVVPLLARAPKILTCVDVSQEQLFLTELRVESIRSFTREEYLAFWGFPPLPASAETRRDLFVRLSLSRDAETYFTGYFTENGWKSLLYDGSWEQTFIKLSLVNRLFTAHRGAKLFDCTDLESQRAYLKKDFPQKAWELCVALLGNASVFNALLYKGHFAKKNIELSYRQLYLRAFDRLFQRGLARENFFLQLLFFGKVKFPEGCPVECAPDVYARAKAALTDPKHPTQVRYRRGDVIEQALRSGVPIDFYSLSDVPSYFTGAQEIEFLKTLAPVLAPDALVVLRHYLHLPEGLDRTGYADVTEQFRAPIDAERLQMYEVEILRHVAREAKGKTKVAKAKGK